MSPFIIAGIFQIRPNCVIIYYVFMILSLIMQLLSNFKKEVEIICLKLLYRCKPTTEPSCLRIIPVGLLMHKKSSPAQLYLYLFRLYFAWEPERLLDIAVNSLPLQLVVPNKINGWSDWAILKNANNRKKYWEVIAHYGLSCHICMTLKLISSA